MHPVPSKLFASSVALCAMTFAVPAFAASLTIEQRSDIGRYGSWAVTPPTGNQIRSNSREERRTISNLGAGAYLFQVDAPDGATTTIRLIENGVIRDSVTAKRLSFSLDAGSTATLQIGYTYQGVITVESIPSGASFELSAPNGIRYTGVTPETFRELPPAYYSVNFGLRSGCSVPRPIKRDLGANEEVVFLGEYHCESASSSSSSFSFSSRSISSGHGNSSSSVQPTARVVHTINQQEVLPGGSIRVTLGIVNTSRSTLSDLTLTEQFDPAMVSIDTLPTGAFRHGNYIVWQIPNIYAGQRWSQDIIVLVSDAANTGTTALTARISGDDLDGMPQGQLASTVTIGIATLPPTGAAFDVLLALFGLLIPAPALLSLRRR